MLNLLFAALMALTALIYIVLLVLFTYRNPASLIYIMLIYVILEKFLVYLGAPSYLKYGTDVICIWMLVRLIIGENKISPFRLAKWPIIFVIAMFIVALFSVAFNIKNSNFWWFLWHVRNYYRMIAFWMCCIFWLRPKDVEMIYKFLAVILLINLLLCSVQHFVFGYKGDYLGGVFGVDPGVNGDMNILLCMAAVYAVAKYLSREIPVLLCFLILAGCVYIAALAELKFIFLELAMIIVCAFIVFKPSRRSVGLMTFFILVSVFGLYFLSKLFPVDAYFFKFDSVMNYANINYGSEGGLSRLSGAQTMYKLFLHSPAQKLFGIGAGNAGTAQFSFLQSRFADNYDGILHYSYNYSAMIIIETGIAGLASSFAFFISNIVAAIKISIKQPSEPHLKIALLFCTLVFPLIYYNAAFKSEVGYFAFFALAIPFAYRRIAKTERTNPGEEDNDQNVFSSRCLSGKSRFKKLY